MTGYYQSLSDDSIYHVYKKGFELYAQCVKCRTREVNNPFPMVEKNLIKMVQWGSWVQIENPNIQQT